LTTSPKISEREFIFLLAAISATTALGIDFTLPAFDQVEEAFVLEKSSSLALIVTVYFLGLASIQTAFGPLADRFGRKVVLNAGLIAYIVSAFAAGAAPSFELLLLSRFLWGVAAGAPRAMTLAIARDVYEGDRLARVVAASTAAFMIVPALAPVFGQGVLNATNWRFAFAAPGFVAIGLWFWVRRLPETFEAKDRRPLSFAKTGKAIGAVLRTKSTLGFTLAMMFDFASFGSFLSSSAGNCLTRCSTATTRSLLGL
jgi:DHA1 family bicyclomycin/chloramphenicol resistance-like MFS transporter